MTPWCALFLEAGERGRCALDPDPEVGPGLVRRSRGCGPVRARALWVYRKGRSRPTSAATYRRPDG